MENIIKYKITTPYGGWYETDNRGYVIKCDNGLDLTNASMHDIMSWQITGIRAVDNFGRTGVIIRLDKASGMTRAQLRFKNGKPRYAIEDIDHGSTRLHGNIKYHGVASVIAV